MTTPLPSSFTAKKRRILEQLSIPTAEYDDLSPKGSVDEGIKDLIGDINAIDGCVTTSSCAGRISVFLEGKRKIDSAEDASNLEDGELREKVTSAGVGGKGGGGRWLFVSHDPVSIESDKNWAEFLGMKRVAGGSSHAYEESGLVRRYIHFKFEPMILHVLTASLQQAQLVLSAALQAGFRESGALNLTSSGADPATPMVGIRTMGLTLESVVGFEEHRSELCIVPEWQLRNLVEISNQRFVENTKRIERFRALLNESTSIEQPAKKQGENGDWEDATARKERKRAEGLERAKAMKQDRTTTQHAEEIPDIGILEGTL